MRRLILSAILILVFTIPASAHPGGTDSSGGHYDHDTGEYHYHHGYAAHEHTDMDGDGDMDCPYDFDDLTGRNSGSPSSSGGLSTTDRTTVRPTETDTADEDILSILSRVALFAFCALIVFGFFVGIPMAGDAYFKGNNTKAVVILVAFILVGVLLFTFGTSGISGVIGAIKLLIVLLIGFVGLILMMAVICVPILGVQFLLMFIRYKFGERIKDWWNSFCRDTPVWYKGVTVALIATIFIGLVILLIRLTL